LAAEPAFEFSSYHYVKHYVKLLGDLACIKTADTKLFQSIYCYSSKRVLPNSNNKNKNDKEVKNGKWLSKLLISAKKQTRKLNQNKLTVDLIDNE